MKVGRHSFTFVLVAVFMAFLVACSGGGGEATDVKQPAPAVENKSTDKSPQQKPPAEEDWTMDFDLGGRKITATAWWKIEFGDSPEHQEIKKNIEELQKKHNFTIEFVTTPFANLKELATSSVLAGEPIADVIRLERRALFPGMVSSGLITPLDEIIDLKGPAGKYIDPMIRETIGEFRGHLYGFEKSYSDFSGLYYNKKMLADAGIKDLHEYVAENKWNWDTLKEILGKVTKGDTFGLAGSQLAITAHALVSNSGNFLDIDAGKEKLSDPRSIEALTFAQELAGMAKISNDSAAIKAAFNQGKVLMYVGYQWEGDGFVKDMGENLGFVPFPVGPKGNGYKSISNPPNFWTIPKGAKNPKELVYLMSKIFKTKPLEEYTGQSRLEGYFADEKDIKAARMMMQSPQYTVMNHDLFPDWNVYQMLNQLYLEKLAPATVVEMNKQLLQAAMDDALNKK